MRLLAYGGIMYVERCRVGKWPDIPEGALSDVYALSEGVRSYGVGFLEDDSPFLILKERQNLENRGGYAFTLLLDPGREVWERFGWNGAKLLTSLFTEGKEIGERLLSNPESLPQQDIELFLSELSPNSGQACVQETETIGALWAGSVVGPPLTVFSPKDIGFEMRPSLECMSDALDGLPLPFRCGMGWLIGGSSEHGRAFGTRLALDEGVAPGAEDVRSCIEQGRVILSDWETILRYEESAIKNRSRLPIWQWPKHFESHRNFFKDIGVLARSYRADTAEEREAFINEVNETQFEESHFKESIRRRIIDVSMSGVEKFTPNRTRSVLQRHLDGVKELRPEHVERLDAQTLADALVERNVSPAFDACRLELDWDTRWSVWRRLITEVEIVEGIPSRLKEAIEDLDDGWIEDRGRAQIRSLVKASIERTAERQKMIVWSDARYDEKLAPWVATSLRIEAERRVKGGIGDDWPIEYLIFGQDVGGARLAEDSEVKGEAAVGLVRALIDVVREGGPFSKESAVWLEHLAQSPFRARVPSKVKYGIAKAGVSGWRWFGLMWRLFHSQTDETDETDELSPPEDERERLRSELQELTGADSDGGATGCVSSGVPNIKALLELLGSVPESCVRSLALCKPSFSNSKSARGWIEGWRALDAKEMYQAELIRFARSVRDALPSEWFPLEEIRKEGLRDLFGYFLAGGEAAEDNRHRTKLREIFGKWPHVESLGFSLNEAFEEIAHDEKKIEAFVNRFAESEETKGILFPQLSSENKRKWVELMAERNDKFAEDARRLYQRILEKGKTELEPYEREVLEFMRAPQGREIKRKVANWYHGILAASDIDINLTRLLGSDPALERPVSSPQKGKSWWQRWFVGDDGEEDAGNDSPDVHEESQTEDHRDSLSPDEDAAKTSQEKQELSPEKKEEYRKKLTRRPKRIE